MTDIWLSNLRPDSRTRQYRDNQAPGLTLRISPLGKKTWCLCYRMRGEGSKGPRRFKLGELQYMPLKAARKAANAGMRLVKAGIDPAYQQQQEMMAETLSEALQDYYVRGIHRLKSLKQIKGYLARHMEPVFGRRKLRTITRRELRYHFECMALKTPIAANRIMAHMSAFFNWAVDQELLPGNPIARMRKPSPENRRDRVLSAVEIRRLWESGGGGKGLTMLRLILVTAQRPGEVVNICWSEIDLDEGWWTIPAKKAKNGLAHRVPLNALAVEILQNCPQTSQYVFPGRDDMEGPMSPITLHHAVKTVESDSMEHFTPHDLRRTAASHMASAGVQRLVVSKILNHVESGVTATYDRHSYDREKLQAMTTWEQKLQSILTGKKADVVNLMKV
jgi:integrase